MMATFSAGWISAEPFVRGLKFAALMNQALEHEDTFRQGRHHFMTAINQVLEWNLAFEQISLCFQAAHVDESLWVWNIARHVVPLGVAYLASRQIEVLHISEAANFVQKHLGKLSLIAMTVATVALFVLGQRTLAVTTSIYLTLGVLDRYNVLPESVQRVMHCANFFIGNFTGLYLGGKFIRLMCTLNLIIRAVEKYFEYKRLAEEKKETPLQQLEKGIQEEEIEDRFVETGISLEELRKLTQDTDCSIREAHIHKKQLPPVQEDVKIEDILGLYNQIDWSKHEHVVKSKLQKDKRWLEVGQFESEPMDYFERSLHHLIESIVKREILKGKPINYDMLEFYCRYIAQELKNQDDMMQADMLIWLGVEGGEYCGTGKFGIIEEVYENLLSQAAGLPLETRVLAVLQQERQRVWQHIYQIVWKTNPFTQVFGELSDMNAIHNMNVFINLIQAGQRFGIPHQAAKNDRTATINPITHYLAFSFLHIVEDCFWKGRSIPQCYFEVKKPQGADWWKAWKWVHLKLETVSPTPYTRDAILQRFSETIGSPQIPITDIYIWWQNWIYRQDDLDPEKQEQLADELQAFPENDSPLTFNGEPFEVNGKIQPKFLKAMLIEMGVFDKPWDLLQDSEIVSDDEAFEMESAKEA